MEIKSFSYNLKHLKSVKSDSQSLLPNVGRFVIFTTKGYRTGENLPKVPFFTRIFIFYLYLFTYSSSCLKNSRVTFPFDPSKIHQVYNAQIRLKCL